MNEHQFSPGISGNPKGRPLGASAKAKVFQKILEKPSNLQGQMFGDILWDNACIAALNHDKDWMMFFLSRVAPAISKKDELDEEYIIKQIDYVLQKTIESKVILVIEERLKEVMKQLPQLQNQNLQPIEFKEE